ncbi:MAG: hypothetical protein R2728_15205 [Chitinophagales bacterium]
MTELADLIAQLMNADKLIILTDIDGLYSGHPNSENSNLIQNVDPFENLDKYITDSNKGEAEGRGGMGSKLNFAKQAAANNINTILPMVKRSTQLSILLKERTLEQKFL